MTSRSFPQGSLGSDSAARWPPAGFPPGIFMLLPPVGDPPLSQKKKGWGGAVGVLACCVCCFVLSLLGPFCPKRRAMASLSHVDDGSSAPASLEILTVFRHSRITTVLAVFYVSTRYSVLMSILGEVRITNLHCLQQFPQDKGFTDVIDVECWLSGNAGGKVHLRASIHVRTATFDDEKWKLITLMCSHMVNYNDLFAPSCGSVGEFTDIKQKMRRAT